MSVKIRLARRGRRKKPYYHIVVADARAPRDGKFIENIGMYNPMTKPATISLERDRAYEWLMKGAQPSETARAILRFKGVYYRKHLMRGVAKGAFSEEKANEMHQAWVDAKEAKIAERVEETRLEEEKFWKTLSGEIKPMQTAKVEAAGEEFKAEGPKTLAEAAEEKMSAEAATAIAAGAEVADAPAVVEEVVAATTAVEVPAVEEAPAVAEAVAEVVADAPKVEEVVADAPKVEEVVADAAAEEAPAAEPEAPSEEKKEEDA